MRWWIEMTAMIFLALTLESVNRNIWTIPSQLVQSSVIMHVIQLSRYDSNIFMYMSTTWWDSVVLNTFSDQDRLNNFRISRLILLYLCDKLKSKLQRQDTVMRCCISVQKRVAITLWCLATPPEHRTVGYLFGVSQSSVCEIVQETCTAIVLQLTSNFLLEMTSILL